jgi:hypothetical protein
MEMKNSIIKKLALAAAGIAIGVGTAWAGVKISQMATAAPLTGSEQIPITQSGLNKITSPSALFTYIKTVDGTGSGLDADLLDGQQGSYYLAATAQAADSAKLGGQTAGAYALSGHTHANNSSIGGPYLQFTGNIARGTVNANGTISYGSGFTITKLGLGHYRINCTAAFAGLPSITVTAVATTDAYGQNLNVGAHTDISRGINWFDVYTGTIVSYSDHEYLAPADVAFDFIAIG